MKACRFVLIFIACLYAPNLWASIDAPRDTVIINGQPITIRADVQIDSIALLGQSWMDDADVAFLTRMNFGYSQPNHITEEQYLHRSNTILPEFGFELNRPFSLKKSKQLNYRIGATMGFATRFDSEELESNVVGFQYNDTTQNIEQIIVIPTELQSEYDTLSVPMNTKPHFKVNLGIEWHGIMRRARGWRVGAMLEFTPIKDQVVVFNQKVVEHKLDKDDNIVVNHDLIYKIQPTQANFLQFKSFASWSPWNSSVFIRCSILWSPKRTEGALSLGYHF